MYEINDLSNDIFKIQNILHHLIEETQYDLINPDVISGSRILNSYIVEYIKEVEALNL